MKSKRILHFKRSNTRILVEDVSNTANSLKKNFFLKKKRKLKVELKNYTMLI